MKRLFMLFTILTLLTMLGGSAGAQCTISQVNMTNAQLISGVAHFSLVFTHTRNPGNKWVTIHLWKDSDYPGYGYGSVPTTTTLDGVSKRPFGTIVIDNSNVSGSGTYTAIQAFVGSYQNDGAFSMLNTSISTLIYNSTTDTYVINDLQAVIPSGTSVVKFDSWSSQASGNQVVHCFCSAGQFPLPSVLPVRLNSFKAEISDRVKFTWTTGWEKNNSHFEVQELVGDQWVNRGTVFAHAEDGNSSATVSYVLWIDIVYQKTVHMGFGGIAGILLCFVILGMFARRAIPMRIVLMVGFLISFCNYSCKKGDALENASVTTHWYRLQQFDRDGASFTLDRIQVRY